MQILRGELLEKKLVTGPFRLIISGSSGVGKTSFCRKFLSSRFIKKPSKVYYFYNSYFESCPLAWSDNRINFESFAGLPDISFFRTVEEEAVVVIDDQYSEIIRSEG